MMFGDTATKALRIFGGIVIAGAITGVGISVYNAATNSNKVEPTYKAPPGRYSTLPAENSDEKPVPVAEQELPPIETIPIDTLPEKVLPAKKSSEEVKQESAQNALDTIATSESGSKVSVPEPLKIGGVEVYEEQHGVNLQLLGVDTKPLELSSGYGSITYYAKSLLFKMEDGDYKILIAEHDAAFFEGQRYDITYNIFKENQKVGPDNVYDMFTWSEKKLESKISENMNDYLDGVVTSYQLKERK